MMTPSGPAIARSELGLADPTRPLQRGKKRWATASGERPIELLENLIPPYQMVARIGMRHAEGVFRHWHCPLSGLLGTVQDASVRGNRRAITGGMSECVMG
jgi:hypothetical protein